MQYIISLAPGTLLDQRREFCVGDGCCVDVCIVMSGLHCCDYFSVNGGVQCCESVVVFEFLYTD